MKIYYRLLFYSSFFLIPVICLPWYYEQYYAPKWVVFYLTAALFLVGKLIQRESPFFVSNSNLFNILILALVGLFSLSSYLNYPVFFHNHFLDWISFIAIVTFVREYFKDAKLQESLLKAIIPPTIIVVGYGFLQKFGLDPIDSLIKNEFPSSTFGFQNRTAEFIGSSLIIQTFYLFKQRNIKEPFVIVLASFTLLCCYYLTLLYCRSVLVGLLLCGVLSVVIIYRRKLKELLKFVLAFSFILLLLGVWKFSSTSQHAEVKAANSQKRIVRLVNTLHMIKDNPFGVGLGNYEFGYIPYDTAYKRDSESHEFSVVRSPHNAYLELAAELGIIPLLVMLTLIFYILRKLMHQVIEEKKSDGLLLLVLFLFYLNVAFWSFPLETPFTFFMAAVLLGGYFSKFSVIKVEDSWLKWGGLSLSLFLIAFWGYRFHYSAYFHFNNDGSYKRLSKACDYFPSNWRACTDKGVVEMNSKQYSDAFYTANRIVDHMPNNFVALKIVGIALVNSGRDPLACKAFKKYVRLTHHTGKFKELSHKYCEKNVK